MGKFEIQSMPVARPENSSVVCAHTTCKGLYRLNGSPPGADDEPDGLKTVEEAAETSDEFADDIELLTTQVAGHTFDETVGVGMLKQNGTVLKPLIKKECSENEVSLYEQLERSADSSLVEMRQLVPKFHGIKTLTIKNKDLDFLVIDDLTKDFKEPCVMDVKIGRRTWDHKASYQKIVDEEKKYHDCKRDLGFCIPGFQVYKLRNSQLVKHGKEFGKTLNKDTAEDAIKTFLNADGNGFCRKLLVQFLACLWRIQHWARKQRRLRLYASSILFVYDARRLRECVGDDVPAQNPPPKLVRNRSLYRPLSLAVLNKDCERIPTGFSGQLTPDGPNLRPRSTKLVGLDVATPSTINNNNTWHKSIHTLKRTHSFQNNYDKDVQNKKQTYSMMLDDLCCEHKSEVWAVAKMIDFAHVHPADCCDIDKNYLDGVESLVGLFEEFLADSD
ncbi:inositol polyphosphate multikinase-like [Cylas formicarius]|uniref:inositol polyphosphate multikinase-like n=1 Tax=Cylas formicarius TaxID=197179 RepID=UPI002958CE38|nr:inositol polyphosphate multikinase-like [Cylas formicarius]XP_060522037.1 inositol polyphosphate multikinase-like [Cylas formicarius]XP_060522038.1 inositol polyphosphate multikinase-like [Cylas formicarius]